MSAKHLPIFSFLEIHLLTSLANPFCKFGRHNLEICACGLKFFWGCFKVYGQSFHIHQHQQKQVVYQIQWIYAMNWMTQRMFTTDSALKSREMIFVLLPKCFASTLQNLQVSACILTVSQCQHVICYSYTLLHQHLWEYPFTLYLYTEVCNRMWRSVHWAIHFNWICGNNVQVRAEWNQIQVNLSCSTKSCLPWSSSD